MSSRRFLEKDSTEPSEVGLGSDMAGVLGHCTGESAASAGEITVSLSTGKVHRDVRKSLVSDLHSGAGEKW